MMYDNIVVPLDGSKLAEASLPYAEELAAKMGSNIYLLTILESEEPQEYEKYWKYIKKIEQNTKYHAEKYNGSKMVEVKTTTRTGYPAKAIIAYARKRKESLIIMASHGRSGLSRWAVGSVADKVVRESNQPVLLIRAKESRSDIREKRVLKKVLIPLDGSARSRKIIPIIRQIALLLEMEVTLLKVVPQKNQAYEEAEAYLKIECSKLVKEGVNVQYRVSVGNAADMILEMGDELTTDLIAMSTRGKNGVSILSLGSVAQKIFLGADSPLLLVKS